VAGGTIHNYYKVSSKYVTPVLDMYAQPDGGNTARLSGTAVTIDSEAVFNRLGILSYGVVDQGNILDTVQIPLSSHYRSANFFSSWDDFGMGITSLVGMRVHYPPNWSGSTISTIESLYTAAVDLRGAGRGVYVGDSEFRFTAPVFVPGSGDPLDRITTNIKFMVDPGSDAPVRFPYMPGDPLFPQSNKHYHHYDHGGPIAYVFNGLLINPDADVYKNRVVLQISGGPTGSQYQDSVTHNMNDDLNGTAIDAFWPKGRPLLPTQR
jgi:hypothetical protein